MAEGGKEPAASENSWESWLGGWMQTAKEKSNSALEFMKKDLSEFTTTMQQETEKMVEMTNSTLKGDKLSENTATATSKVKAGLTSFLDNISKALVIPPEDDAGVPMKVSADGSGLYDRGKARLHALQLDASTYLDPARGSPEQYIMWVESFDMDLHKGEISELLVSKVEVRALYTKLVPNEVSHAEFWQRYFYRVHQLDCDEARKQALMKRADAVKGDSMSWDDDDWSGGEEDDGNQSDWEKMPRPSQTAEAKSLSESKEHSPQLQAAPSESVEKDDTLPSSPSQQEPNPEQDFNTVQLKECGESSAASLPSTVSNDLPDSPHTEPQQGPPPTQKEQNLADLSAAAEDETKSEEQRQGQLHSEPSAELWSLHIPEDTASSAPGSDGNGGGGGQDAEEHGQSPDVAVAAPSRNLPSDRINTPEDSGACAAAAGDGDSRRSVSNTPVVSVADGGACGASDLVVSTSAPLVKFPPETMNTEAPAASEDALVEQPSGEATVRVLVEQASSEAAVRVPVEQASSEASVRVPSPVSDSPEEEPKDSIPNTPEEGEAQLEVPVVQSDQDVAEQINVRVKGDMVVVGDRDSPSSDSSDNKERKKKLGEDWDEDFDIEVTEEDLKAAEDIAKKLGENLDDEDDDWENWE